MQIHQPILRLFFGHNGSRILYDVQYHLTLIEMQIVGPSRSICKP